MSYGFVFPKQGKELSDGVKDMAWRDDQTVFMARMPIYTPITIPSGSNLNYTTLNTDFTDVETDKYYLFRTFLTVGTNNYAIDPSNQLTLGGATAYPYSKAVQTTIDDVLVQRVTIGFTNSGTTSSAIDVVMTTYLIELGVA